MPFSVQRVPRGLSDLLSIFGGQSPQALAEDIRGTIDLLQFYGMNQQQSLFTNNAALAEGGFVTHTVPNNQYWLLFNGHVLVTPKTATMTALRVGVGIVLPGDSQFVGIHSEELGPFGATEAGNVRSPFVLPYPRLLMPRTLVRAALEILGTDATADIGLTILVGVLG